MGFFDLFSDTQQKYPTVNTILPDIAKQEIEKGKLPQLQTDNIFLKSGEFCCYIDKAILLVEKIKKTYRHYGMSGKGLFKGTRVNFGQGVPIEHKETYQYKGILYITNKRVILQCRENGFDKPHKSLTAIKPYNNAIELQYGAKTYTIFLPNGLLAEKVLKLVN